MRRVNQNDVQNVMVAFEFQPCRAGLTIDSSENHIFLANYSNNLEVIILKASDGTIIQVNAQ